MRNRLFFSIIVATFAATSAPVAAQQADTATPPPATATLSADAPTEGAEADATTPAAAGAVAGEPAIDAPQAGEPAASAAPTTTLVTVPTETQPTPGYTAPPRPRRERQAREKRSSMRLLLGPGFGLQVFNAGGVNEYMEDEMDAYVETSEGFSAIVLSLVPRVSLSFAPMKYLEIQLFGEIGIAPKAVVSNIGTDTYLYIRSSGGGLVTGHIPLQNGRKALFIGGGAYVAGLRFEGTHAITPGYRGVIGLRFYTRRAFSPEIFVAFDWVRAKNSLHWTTNEYDISGNQIRETGNLDYTGGTVGANFYFDLLP